MGQTLRQMVDSGILDAASRPVSNLAKGMTIEDATKHMPGKPVENVRDGVVYPAGNKFSNAPVRDKAKDMEVDADDDEDSSDDDEEDMSAGPVAHLAKNQRVKIQDIEDDTKDEDYSDDKPQLTKKSRRR